MNKTGKMKKIKMKKKMLKINNNMDYQNNLNKKCKK